MHLKADSNGDVEANREYVNAMLGLEVWSHSLYEALHASAHEAHHQEHVLDQTLAAATRLSAHVSQREVNRLRILPASGE